MDSNKNGKSLEEEWGNTGLESGVLYDIERKIWFQKDLEDENRDRFLITGY